MGIYGWSKTIAQYQCTPPSTAEKLGERISSSTGSDKEIAGLKKKRKKNIMMIRKISSFSRAKLEAGMNGLGL